MLDHQRPLVSVVIPTHNRSTLVRRAIESALGQDYPRLEIVVVDDGSTDETPDVLSAYEDIRVIRLEPNQGGAAARNQGIQAAAGEFVAFLDSDDEWLRHKLSRQVPVLEARPEVGAVYCRHYSHDDGTGRRAEQRPPLYTGIITRELLRGRCPRTVSLFLVRKQALESVGGFDESLAGFQDTDLWIRLSHEWEFEAVDEPLAIVHEHLGVRVTTDPATRERALDSFLAKWGDEMAAVMGSDGLATFQRGHRAVAQGTAVLAEVAAGRRVHAFVELRRYFSIAGLSKPPQAVGLLIACVAGIRVHHAARSLFRSSRAAKQ